MATLVEAAQRMMDLYYQDYAPSDKFLDIDDFKYQIAITYSSLLNKMYQTERRANKQIEGFSNIEIPAAWLVKEDLVVEYDETEEKFFSKLKHPVYSFDWDNAANGLMGIHKRGGGPHCVYRKISLNERRFRQIIPPTSAIFFYLNTPTEIVYWGAKKGAKIESQYLPVVVGEEDDCILSDNIIADLEVIVLDTMFKAKNGNFTQELADQNSPNTPAPQQNPTLNKK
jgi:hypothetical protein